MGHPVSLDTPTGRIGGWSVGLLDVQQARYRPAPTLTGAAAVEAANRTLTENNTLLQKKMDDYNATLQGLEAKLRDLSGNLDSARQSNEKLTTEKKQAEPNKAAPQRSAPVVLDAQALRHVAGGNTTQGPHKTW